MHPDLKGKTALVTGAGKKTGAGYAIADRRAHHAGLSVSGGIAGHDFRHPA
jgi:NAD(P)-dependent dehydrogenase (short-subunit alcohol dehydrogenase family)